MYRFTYHEQKIQISNVPCLSNGVQDDLLICLGQEIDRYSAEMEDSFWVDAFTILNDEGLLIHSMANNLDWPQKYLLCCLILYRMIGEKVGPLYPGQNRKTLSQTSHVVIDTMESG
jgi:hypothetical protein